MEKTDSYLNVDPLYHQGSSPHPQAAGGKGYFHS
jgi:hypothetical protein